ncbi:MAG TPA: hypothetical protein VEL31_09315 [Ktedonobacteraceae bacterium]|nr:hypothetical protein [Ktedonobacteraceae bacterium]
MNEKPPEPRLEPFVQMLQPGKTRARLRDKDSSVGIYIAYHEDQEAPFEFRLIIDGETRFARLREFTLMPNAFM